MTTLETFLGLPISLSAAQLQLAEIPDTAYKALVLRLLGSQLSGTITGGNVTPSIATSTGNASTTAGVSKVFFMPKADWVGTIGGVAFTGADYTLIPFEAPAGKGLASIAWTRSAGTLVVVQI